MTASEEPVPDAPPPSQTDDDKRDDEVTEDGLPWRLPAPGELDIAPSPWPVDPPLVIEPSLEAGPVLVTVEYRVAAEHHAAFRELLRELGRARRRTGAEQWGLFQDGSDPDCFVETFLVATWEEHLRQHGERSTASDRALLQRAAALASDGPRVRHLFYAYGEPQ